MSVPESSLPPWAAYSERQRWVFLAILFWVSTSNYLDRNIISILLEPIKQEFQISDTMLGLLGGFCFAVFYALFGMPVARWADRGNRATIITLALSVWSTMTILCGLAQTFWQLALARIGVGAGESGAIPPAQSLIADYFPPERRASAIGIFSVAATAGYLLGLVMGGYIAAAHGWRMAFIVAGVPGLALALLTRYILVEPRLQVSRIVTAQSHETPREALAKLKAKRAFLFALAGSLLYFYFAYGALTFVPSFLIRCLHMPLAHASLSYGTMMAAASLLGTLGGGWLGDRLGRRDVRWLAWLPAAACAMTAPIYALAFSVERIELFLALGFLAAMLLSAGLPSMFAAVHAICGSRRRATAVAIVLFSATLFGGGFGPLVAGALSDGLTAPYGVDGLRYALMLTTTALAASAGCYYFCGRAMPSDLEE